MRAVDGLGAPLLRSTLTATTLALGEEPSPAETEPLGPVWKDQCNLYDCVIMNPDKGIHRVALVIQWVETNGPMPGSKLTCGFDLEVNEIFQMLRKKDSAINELATLDETYEKQRVQIQKAQKIQLAKWAQTKQDQPKKMGELDAWVTAKLSEAFKPVTDQRDAVNKIKEDLDHAMEDLIKQLSNYDPLAVDEDCQDLVRELESKFGEMELDDSGTMTPELNAATLALEHVQALPDGPQKKALLAVLEVAATSSPETTTPDQSIGS